MRRPLAAAVAALLLSAGLLARPLPAPAQPMAAGAGPARPHLISVNRCDPQRQLSTAPVYGGFAPAFYPFGPVYYWRDPYGFNYYQPPVVDQNGTLYLDYVNATPHVMGTIDFGLIANGRLVAEVRDVGTFSPNIEIKHQFGLDANVFPLRTALARCVPLRIAYKDGTPPWTNPNLPAMQRGIYRHHPH